MKRYLLYGLGSLVVVVLLAGAGAAVYLQFFLPDVDPPPDISVELTPERIQRGAYLANHVSACMDCHSERDWSRFAAPPVEATFGQGGQRFGREEGLPGVLYSRNITPEGIGDWTDGEIFRAITSGMNREGKPLFPLMPYEKYGYMDPEDIKAIIAYLRTLPPKPAEHPPRELDFPVNWIVRAMPGRPNHLTRPDPEEDMVAYGRYMTYAAACSSCHHKPGSDLSYEPNRFAGGFELTTPQGDSVRSANLTPDPATGLGGWTEDAFVERFKMMEGYDRKLSEGEVNTVMPWLMYAGMEERDLRAIWRYLSSLEPVEHSVPRRVERPSQQ